MREPGFPERRLFGIAVHAVTLDQVVCACDAAIRSRAQLVIGVVNAAKIVQLRRDALLRASIAESDLVLADGMAVVWAARLLGQRLPERVAGIDLFFRLLELADERHYKVYLLGAEQRVLDEACVRIAAQYPGVAVSGARNGYFSGDEVPDVVHSITQSGADMLFVAMSPPKKEIFLQRHARALGVPVCHGVGGSFDVLAGKTRRAPVTWQRAGLEWAYRVLQEPRRLWYRYLVTNVRFVGLVSREVILRLMRRRRANSGRDGAE